MKKTALLGLLIGILSLVSCSTGTIYDNSSTFCDENNSSKSEYADSINPSNIEEEDTSVNNHEFYCILPQSFIIEETTYISYGLISDLSISVGDLIGYLVNSDFDDEKKENLIYVTAQFQTHTNDSSLPLHLLVGNILEEAVVIRTSLFDFVYIAERSLK